MPIYEHQPCAACGGLESLCRASELVEEGLKIYVPCDCGKGVPLRQLRTPPNISCDGLTNDPVALVSHSKRFKSRRDLERWADKKGLDVNHTSGRSWQKGERARARQGAEELANEMGYSSRGAYQEKMKNAAHRKKSVNEARERNDKPRD